MSGARFAEFLQERCVFWDAVISQLRSFTCGAASVFCNKVVRVKKVSSRPLRSLRAGASSEVAASGWRDGRQTWRDLLAAANQKS